MPRAIGRRSIVQTLGLAGLTLALRPGAGHAAEASADLGPALNEWLSVLFADPESARRVGLAYLKMAPEEANRDWLLARLFSGLDPKAWRLPEIPSMWRQSFATRCRQDFAEGRTVRLDGWVLSLTEARLCALAALA